MGVNFDAKVSWEEESDTMAKPKNYKKNEDGTLVLDENGNPVEILDAAVEPTVETKEV